MSGPSTDRELLDGATGLSKQNAQILYAVITRLDKIDERLEDIENMMAKLLVGQIVR